MQNLLQTGLSSSTASILYTWLVSSSTAFLVVIFDANSCYLHLFSKLFLAKTTSCQLLFLMRILVTCIFFQSCFSQRLLVARLLIGLFPRLLWAILQPLSPAKIVNTMNLSKNRIQLFILSSRNFLNSFSKSFFFCVFPKVVFLKTYWLRSGLYLLI